MVSVQKSYAEPPEGTYLAACYKLTIQGTNTHDGLRSRLWLEHNNLQSPSCNVAMENGPFINDTHKNGYNMFYGSVRCSNIFWWLAL